MELFLNNTPESLTIELFTHYTRLVKRNKVNIIKLSKTALKYIEQGDIKIPCVPSLLTPSAILTDFLTICNYLADQTFTKDILLN